MANLYVQESYINRTEGYRFGDSDVYESFTDNRGELYRFLQSEYGRCVGKVHVETAEGDLHNVGWVFLGRSKYEDSDETYLREVWVTLHSAPPTRTTEYHYATA